jgi:hypothetical protein
VKLWLAITVLIAAALVPDGAEAQRAMRLGGGSPRMGAGVRGSVPVARGGAGFGSRGVFVGSGGFVGNRGPFIGNRGFVGNRGVFIGNRGFRGGVGFGHNPRFHVFFGSGRRGFRSGFFNSGFGFPFYGGYPLYYGGYGYPLDYDQYYDQSAAQSQYAAVQGQNSYAEGYQQGINAQQVQQLTDEVERLRAEMQERDRQIASANQPPSRGYAPSMQELPLSTTLVFRDGHQLEIHNYAIVGSTVWIFNERTAKKVALGDLDLEATKRVNADRGIMFVLPGMR